MSEKDVLGRPMCPKCGRVVKILTVNNICLLCDYLEIVRKEQEDINHMCNTLQEVLEQVKSLPPKSVIVWSDLTDEKDRAEKIKAAHTNLQKKVAQYLEDNRDFQMMFIIVAPRLKRIVNVE